MKGRGGKAASLARSEFRRAREKEGKEIRGREKLGQDNLGEVGILIKPSKSSMFGKLNCGRANSSSLNSGKLSFRNSKSGKLNLGNENSGSTIFGIASLGKVISGISGKESFGNSGKVIWGKEKSGSLRRLSFGIFEKCVSGGGRENEILLTAPKPSFQEIKFPKKPSLISLSANGCMSGKRIFGKEGGEILVNEREGKDGRDKTREKGNLGKVILGISGKENCGRAIFGKTISGRESFGNSGKVIWGKEKSGRDGSKARIIFGKCISGKEKDTFGNEIFGKPARNA